MAERKRESREEKRREVGLVKLKKETEEKENI